MLENRRGYDWKRRGIHFLRIWIRRSSSILAIAGGALFLVLPVAFSNGTVSIIQPASSLGVCASEHGCRFFYPQPMPAEKASALEFLGVIGIFLGLLSMILGEARTGFALVIPFSLGLTALLFWLYTSQILGTFITTPPGFLVFPELSVVAMVGATVLFSYELARAGISNRVPSRKSSSSS